MIKHRIFSIVTFICMLMCASMSMAQEVYVDVRPKQNPLPAQAALYVENPGRFFNVTLTNISEEPVPVRLEVRLEGPIESQLDIWPDGGDYLAIVANRPIDYYQYLGAGQPRTMTDSELNLMFNRYVNNERYAGGRLAQLFDDVAGGHVGLLPEGHYGLKIIVKTNYIDQNDQGRIIGEGECYFDISYKASAPSFIEPNSSQGSGYIKADFPYQTGRFAWTPPTFSNNRLGAAHNILYDFRIMRVTNGMSPYEAATSGAVAYEQKGLMTTFCNVPYSVISTLRRSGTTQYVAQVTARPIVTDASSNQFVMIENEGKSEIMDLYLPPFSSSGHDGDIGIPGDGDYPIITTITPKATLLTNNMTPYFESPSDLFTVTLKNTSSKEYEVSMLIQYHRENWGVCPTPALQHSNQSMTIPGGAEITLDDDELDRLAGGYPLESIIAFKAQSGFIIGPPSDYNFQYPNNLATIRVCEYTGQPVLRERIIGKARCEYAVDAAVSVGDDLKAELIAKLPNLPTDAEVYFTNPSRLFKLKITNLGLTTKKFTGVIEYIVDDNVSYSGYDEKNAHTEQYFEIPSGKWIELSDADFDKLFGGFKSIKIIRKGEENSSNQTETNKPFSDAKFVFEDEGTNSANINIFDYEKLLKDRSKPREALLHTHSLNFTISDYVNLDKVGITIEPCLKHMPDWLNPYFERPGTLFKITLKNYTKETLTLLPHITYTSIEEDGTYQYTPFNSYAEAMSPLTLPANEEKPLSSEEINKFFGGLTDRDENNDGLKDVLAYQYKEETGEQSLIGNTEKGLSTEELFSAWIRLFDAKLYESVPKDDPQRIEKITVSENKYSFKPSAESTTDILTVEVTPKMAQMPINAEAYFTKPHKLWNVTLHNNLDEPIDVILYPIYAFDDQYGISYVIHKKDELQRYAVKLKPFQNWVLTEEEIYKYFAAHDIVYQKREETGTLLTDELSRLDLEDITVGVNADNMLQLLVLNYDITSKQSSGNINEYVHGSTSATWRGAEETYLNDIEIKVTPKEDPLVDDAALYFKNPGILFNVELKNNTFKDQKLLLTTTYRFHEDGAFYSGDFSNRLDSAIIVPKNEPKILTNNELNKLCGNLKAVNEITPTAGGNQSKLVYSLSSIKLNYTSYNQIEVNAYNVDSLKFISKDDENRKLRAFLGTDRCDFNIREGQNNVGLKVKITPKNDVAFKLEPDSYFESPGDYFDITLTNDRAEDIDVKLRLTYNKRFYGEDRDSVITLKGKSELKLSKDRINNIVGKYNIYSDKINELDEKGKHIGTKTGEDVVLKQGTNIVSALMWRAPKKDLIDQTNPKDQKIKIDSICVHDTIFVPAAGKVKIGKYELTIEEIEKVTGSDKEQEKLKYECFKGKGYIKVKPFGAEANLNVEWDSIYINWKDAVVTKGLVRSAKPTNQFFPAELFTDDMKKQLKEADSTLYKTKVDSIITNGNFTEYYRWVQKDMQYLRNMTGDRVTLPVGLSLPLKADGQCPADIQLAQMQFTPEKATLDIIGEFILPETDYLGDVTYDNGVAKYTGDILVFAAQDLETTPEKFLPTSGSVGLLTDITIHDPSTGFDFTFVAPKERFSKATSGCFITWQNGEFGSLSASIKVNVPGGEIVKVVDGVVDENGAPPAIQVDAFINDGSDWFGNVSMDNFEIVDLPGYTFTLTSAKGAGDTGIYYDHSRRTTRGAEVKSGESGRVEFHPDYYDKTLGGTGKPATDQKAYNAWQGFYFKEVALELPAYDILNNTDSVPRPKISINNLMYDDTGFSGSAAVKNIIDYQKDGWRFAIDSIAVSILQGNFRDTGFKGKIGFPLLKKAAGLDSVNVDTTDIANPIYPTKFDYAYLTYQAKVIAIDKTEKHKGGTSTTFELGQELDSIYIDCFLAKVKLQDDKTWFWLNHNTTREKKKQTYFDFSLGGDITISAGDIKLPAIPFSGLGYANCTKAEKEAAEKGAEAPKTNATKPGGSGTQINGPDGKRFSLGDWDFNKNDATNDNSFKGFPLYVDSLSFDVDGIDNIGVKFRCGLSLLGNKKAGVAGSVGLGVYAKINWDNLSLKYDRTEVTDVSLDGNFGGVVTISGGLKVCDSDSLSGFETLPGKPLHLGIKGLFDLNIAGGYYKVRKTAADFAIDSYSEKQDSTYHAGYFLGKASKMNIPIGPVALNMVMGGLFINYSTTAGGVSGTDNSFYDAIQSNAKIKYKTYGGAFGIGLSSVGSDALLKGDLNFMLLMDLSGDEVKVPEFHMQGNIHALCAPDSEDGLINSRVDLLYQNNINERDPQPDQCKSFTLNLTTSVDGTVDQLYEQFTGEKLEVPEAVGDYLNKFDAKNASEENKGEGNDTSDKSAKSESKGFLKGGCSAEIKMELQIRNYPYAINDKGGKGKTFWHLYIGKPTPENERCRITFIDFEIGKGSPVGLWAKVYANAYLCMGNELPDNGALPPVPDKVLEALGMKGADGKSHPENMAKLQAAREEQLSGFKSKAIDGGIMFGAALGAEIGCNAVFCYASVEGMLGFDVVLKKLKAGETCGDGKLPGLNGFYVNGQVYAMFKGELGLMLDLWIYKGKVPLVDMTLGALLKAGFPNPTWVYGRVRAAGSVLGGLIKFNSTIELKAGKICIPTFGNPLDDVEIFGDFNPGDEELERGWAEENAVSPYGSVSFTTNMKMGKYLPLVDQRRTAENIGMGDIPEDDEQVEDKSVLRTYVFRLGRVDEETGEPFSGMPTFELAQFKNGNNDKSPETEPRYIEFKNPSGDKENFTLVTGSLKENKFYRVTLAGYCKEIINSKEVNPVFNDSTTNYKDKSIPWYQYKTVYFRTGNLSDKIQDNIAGFTPSATDENYNYYTASLEDVINPTVMMKYDCEDYWNSPDHEFTASVMEYVTKTDERGQTVGEWVYPDAKNGLYRGQKSIFQDLDIRLMTEEGVDENGDEYFYQTVKLAQPLESRYFKKGGRYKFEIVRFNRKLMTDHINLIEQRYEDMMKIVESDKATFEAALEEMNDEERVVAKQMYDYYMSMEEEYGENTAEQRKTEFVEQAKQNSEMFAETVWSHEYTYNGFSSFQDYIKSNHRKGYAFSNGSKRIGTTSKYFTLPIQYQYYSRNLKDYNYNRFNNPYYAMNFWHSKAFVWYSGDSSDKDGKLDKFKYCDANIMACQGIDYATYEETYTSQYSAPTLKSSLPPYAEFRTISIGLNGYDWAGTRSDSRVSNMLDPINGRNYRATSWHNIREDVYHLGGYLSNVIKSIYINDCDAVKKFEANWRYLWLTQTNYSNTKDLSGKNLKRFKDKNTVAATNNSMTWGSETTTHKGLITAPKWQMALMLGADNGLIDEVKDTRPTSVASYKSLMGEPGYAFDSNLFLNNFKSMTFKVRYADGYNQRTESYGVRPENQAIRRNKLVVNFGEKGLNGSATSFSISNDGQKIHFSDPEFYRYLIAKCDNNEDGSLSPEELNSLRDMDVDYYSYRVKSFAGLELLSNVEKVSLRRFNHWSVNFKPTNPYIDLNLLPKLKEVVLLDTDCENVRFDVGKAENLERIYCRGSNINAIRFTPNPNLTSFQATDCYFDAEYIKNYKNLTYLDLEKTGGSPISIVGLHKLTYINVKSFEYENHKFVTLIADNIPAYNSLFKSDKFKINNSYTGKAEDCKVKVEWISVNPSQLDENLRKAIEEKVGGTFVGSSSAPRKLTTLDVSGRKIKSLKYLEAFCPLLQYLNVDDNKLSELDLSGFNDLTEVSASNNVISYVDVAEGNVITELNVSNNQIPSLPTQKLGKLRTLNCSNNYVEELYGNHLKEIRYLDCSNNMLTELILDQTYVKEVDCSNNKLSVFKLPNSTDMLEKFSANNCFGGDVNFKLDFTKYSKLRELSLADNAGLTELKIPTHDRLESVVARNCNLQGAFTFSPGLRTTEIYPLIETIDMSNNPNLKVLVHSPYFGLNYVKDMNFTGCNVISVVIGGLPSYASGLQVRVGVPQRLTGNKVKIQFTDGGVDWFERWEEWRKYPENQHTVVAFTLVDGVAKYYDSQSLTLEKITKECQEMQKDFGEKLYASLLKEKNKGKAIEEQSRVFKVSDANALTELNAANMNIKDLVRVLRWMPNLTTIDASGNDISTINLQNQKIDEKAVYPLKNVTSLNLSNNSELNTLMIQPISMLELSNSNLNTTTFNHVLQRVTNKLTINNPGGTVTAYAIDGNSKAKIKALHYGNTSKPLNVSYCDLDTLVIDNATLRFSNLSSNAKNISIDNIVVKGQNAVVSTGNQKRINGEMVSVELNTPIAKNVTFENAVMGGSSLNNWILLTTDQLSLKNCTATSDLTITAEGAKKLTLEKMNANVKVSSCDFSQLTLNNASIILGGENTSQINIDQFRISGNSTIYFQTADMMLMWLYNWKDQNPGQDVNVRVSAMTQEKESLALLANTFIGSGQLDLNNMSQVEIIKALNYLIGQGYLPKGDLYDNLINKLTKGEPLVEPTTEEDRLMRSDFGEKLYNSLLSNKNKDRAVKSEVLHVEDVKPLTKLNAANMDIKDLTRVLRWMPNLTDVNASGNNIETINLQNQMLEGKAVYPLKNVTSLNLSNNSKLSSLAMQSVDNVNLTGTAVNTNTFSHVVQRTKNKLVINSPVKAVSGSYTLDCLTKPLKVLYYVNTSHNMNITSCNLDTLVANSARITLGGSNTTGIEIKHMKVNSSTTIYVQSADMMLMWLLGWQKQNVGVTVTFKVAAMTSAIATNCNTYLGTINLNNMSQTEILNVVNTLIGKYGLPKGDRYDNVMSKINNGEKLVEYSVATLPIKGVRTSTR